MKAFQKLGFESLDIFLDDIWETRAHYYSENGSDHLREFFSLEVFEKLLGASNTGLSIIANGMARPVAKNVTDIRQIHSTVHEAYLNGCSVLQTEISENWPALACLCREMTAQLLEKGISVSQPVNANAYLTPAHSQAFNLHYDNHCAFILQIAGTKDWQIFHPDTKLPIDRCTSQLDSKNLGSACFSGTLQAGDVLYVPRGFPHVAKATDTSSLHVTISLKAQTWADVIYALCVKDGDLRRSFRYPNFGIEKTCKYFDDFVRPLILSIDIRKYLEEIKYRHDFLNDLSGYPDFAGIDRLAELTLHDVVFRDPDSRCHCIVKENKVWLLCGGKVLPFETRYQSAIEYICQHSTFLPNDLSEFLSPLEIKNLIQLLTIKGIVNHEDVPGFAGSRYNGSETLATEY